jgi:radical SAM superfamily enzyme YgiQ (UPF0313 family)
MSFSYRKNYVADLDLLFVSMPSRATSLFHPLAFVMLCGYLAKYSGYKTDIFEAKLPAHAELNEGTKKDIEVKIFELVFAVKPKFVGFSLFPGDLHEFLPLATRLKEISPSTKIIVGGVLPTIDPKCLLLKETPVDYVVKGDGEMPLLELLAGSAPAQIEGIWTTSSENGHSIHRGVFDYLPSYEKLDMDYYCQVSTGVIRPYYTKGVLVLSSIGCPHQCTFCFNPSRNIKYKSIDVFIAELKMLKNKYNINSFGIIDECFLAKKSRVVEFCEKYISSGIDMPFSMQTRANLLKEDIIQKLKAAGCVQIAFGVESGSDRLLEKINKGMLIEEDVRAFELCNKYKIKTFANILFNLPGETENDIALTQKFLRHVKPSHVAISLTVPLLGTQIYDEFVHPRLEPCEYKIYASNDPYVGLVDDRFKMAAHSLDLKKLIMRESLKFYLKSSFGLVSFQKWYRKGVFKSMPKGEFFKALRLKVYVQMRTYVRALSHLFST